MTDLSPPLPLKKYSDERMFLNNQVKMLQGKLRLVWMGYILAVYFQTLSLNLIHIAMLEVIPLLRKQEEEFIKNGIKNFTHSYREWKCFDSVNLWKINDLISLPPCIRLDQFFASILAKKQIFFARARAGWAVARGQNNSDLLIYLRQLTRYYSSRK